MGDRALVGGTTPLANELLFGHAYGGKVFAAARQVAGSCHWQLIFDCWTNHPLGYFNPTPRKGTMIVWANLVKILKERMYRVANKDNYRGHLLGQALSRPRALQVKFWTDTQRNHLNAVQGVFVERRGHSPRSCGRPWPP